MPSLTPPDHGSPDTPSLPSWSELVNQLARESAIRWTLFAAFISTLAAVVLLVAIGGPLTIAAIFALFSGGGGLTLHRIRSRDESNGT